MSSQATDVAATPNRQLDESARLAMTAIRQRLQTNASSKLISMSLFLNLQITEKSLSLFLPLKESLRALLAILRRAESWTLWIYLHQSI